MDRRTVRMLMESLNRDAQRIARHFGLRYASIEAERSNVTSRYGICYSDGVIKIRLRHAKTGRPLKYSSLVSTLCHELAHLRHFDHGLHFRAFNQEVLAFARARGIYRPRAGRTRELPAGGASPPQALPAPRDRRQPASTPSRPPQAVGPRQLDLL